MSNSPWHLDCSLPTRVRVEGSGLGAEGQSLLRPARTLSRHSKHRRELERAPCGGLARTISWNRSGPARCDEHRTGPNPTDSIGESAWLACTLPHHLRLHPRRCRAASASLSTPLNASSSCSSFLGGAHA